MTLVLRDYQRDAIDAVFAYWQNEPGNPLIDLATGTGKSLVMAQLITELLSGWPHMRVVVAAHVEELISQNYEELVGIWPFAPAGIYAASLNRRDHHAQIMFASIHTVYNKTHQIGHVDVLMVDECHLIPFNDDTKYRRFIAGLREINPDMKIVGLTATDYRLDGGRLTEHDDRIFDEVVYSYGIGAGIADGYLTPLTSKAMDTAFDLTGVGKLGGDYKQNALQAAVDKADVTNAAVAEIVAKGHDRRSWLIFGSGVDHAAHIRDAIRAHGIVCETITGDTPKQERRDIIEAYKNYEIRALTNNSVLCLDDKTEILTRQGWIGIDEMSYGHDIAAWADNGSVEFTKPEFIVRRDRLPGEKMVSVESRKANMRVTANHRMIVSANRNSGWNIKSAEEVAGVSGVYFPTSGNSSPCSVTVERKSVDYQTMRKRINVVAFHNRRRGESADDARLNAAVQCNARAGMRSLDPRELTLDHCAFIGFWLGDGHLGDRCEFAQSTRYPYIIDWFDRVLARIGFAHSKALRRQKSGKGMDYVSWSIARGTGAKEQARNAGYYLVESYLDKRGSDLLWGLDEKQFESLMNGFWLADGNHRAGNEAPKGGYAIAGTQYPLYNLLQAIGACRGFRFTLQPIPQRVAHHSPQWRMAWRRQERMCLIRDLMQVEGDWHSERVWCVTSTTGRLITRRGGKVTVMGNTTGFNHKGVDLLAFMRPTQSLSLYVQMAGRATRPLYARGMPLNTPDERKAAIAASEKPNALVLDFAKLAYTHGPVDMVKPKTPGKGNGEAPVKQCPECDELIHISVMKCTCCGYEFPPSEEIKLTTASGGAPILSTEIDMWRAVAGRDFNEHPGRVIEDGSRKPDSVKATFMCGLLAVNSWICPGHTGFAKTKADMFWADHGGQRPFPASAGEFLMRQLELRDTAEIEIEYNGKYPNVRNYRVGAHWAGDRNEETVDADRSAELDDEIPW